LRIASTGNRKQRMIGVQWHHLAGLRIGRRDHAALPIEDEGAGRLSDRELRQEIRDPRQFDDDGNDTILSPEGEKREMGLAINHRTDAGLGISCRSSRSGKSAGAIILDRGRQWS